MDDDQDDETPGVDDQPETPDIVERVTTGGMKLRPQFRKEYNVFNINGKEEEDPIVVLDELDRLDAEYLFLTETLGWKEGLKETESPKNKADVKYIAQYLFVTEQMGWKQGLKLFGEKGEDAIQKELQQIHDIEGFQPKHWH